MDWLGIQRFQLHQATSGDRGYSLAFDGLWYLLKDGNCDCVLFNVAFIATLVSCTCQRKHQRDSMNADLSLQHRPGLSEPTIL
jgi:hypothetical protein